jgi:HPt (histidine-containing phosphotransfer) domain-containing protein
MDLIEKSKPRISSEAILRYISRRQEDIEKGQRFLDAQDWDSLFTIGHQLQGNAKTFGFPDLEPLGHEIERAVLARDVSLCQRNLAQLAEWLRNKI